MWVELYNCTVRLDISRQSMPFKKGNGEEVGDAVNRETSLPGPKLACQRKLLTTTGVFNTASDFLFCHMNKSPPQAVSPLSELWKS